MAPITSLARTGLKQERVRSVRVCRAKSVKVCRMSVGKRKEAEMAKLLALAGLALTCALGSGNGTAQDTYPSKPVRIVVPFAAGGPTDQVARVVGAKLSDLLGQPFLVENKAGAGGNIGADLVAKAPVGQVGVTPCVLAVNSAVPVTNVRELIALLKANPGKYSYGSSGMGSILHLCGEQFKTSAGGLQAVHVPYRGSAPMMADLVAGQIALAFDALPTVLPQVQGGRIRAIGGGMATRARAMPDLPTLQEQGVSGFECYTWNAILAPAKTPAPIVA